MFHLNVVVWDLELANSTLVNCFLVALSRGKKKVLFLGKKIMIG